MEALNRFSTTELQAEVARRAQAEQSRLYDERLKRWTAIHAILTQEVVDAFVPRHGRTSCSDDDTQNSLHTDAGAPRCNRCAFLDLLRGGNSPSDFALNQVEPNILIEKAL